MTQLQQLPFHYITSSELAAWLDQQANAWWQVDGDPVLMGRLNMPCPSDELAAELRKFGLKRLMVVDTQPNAQAHGDVITRHDFPLLADKENRRGERNFLLRWDDGSNFWLLTEDIPASEDLTR